MSAKDRSIRRKCILAAESIVIFSAVYSIIFTKELDDLLLALLSALLVLLPAIIEKLLKSKISLPFYVMAILFALSHMIGHVFNLYSIVTGYDKILHFTGGIVFAVVGIYIFQIPAGQEKQKRIYIAIFGLCFSLSISVLWEFIEYTGDQLFHMDMQRDAVVEQISSYYLGNEIGEVGSIASIKETTVNGQKLPINGYLDIGLHDTMKDMIIEAIGAFFTIILFCLDNGRHPILKPI